MRKRGFVSKADAGEAKRGTVMTKTVPRILATIAGLRIGEGSAVTLMGALNVSPESFYSGSIAPDLSTLVKQAVHMVEAGASLVDVGALSTAPYRETAIAEGGGGG